MSQANQWSIVACPCRLAAMLSVRVVHPFQRRLASSESTTGLYALTEVACPLSKKIPNRMFFNTSRQQYDVETLRTLKTPSLSGFETLSTCSFGFQPWACLILLIYRLPEVPACQLVLFEIKKLTPGSRVTWVSLSPKASLVDTQRVNGAA